MREEAEMVVAARTVRFANPEIRVPENPNSLVIACPSLKWGSAGWYHHHAHYERY